MLSETIENMVYVAECRVNLAICEATLGAMRAITTNPETSKIIEAHDNACTEAYWELQSAEQQAETDSEFETYGTKEEWEALSDEDKDSVWEEFHSQCALGIGYEMYFYQVLSNKFLVGYVGH